MAKYVFVNIIDNHFKVWGYDLFSSSIDSTGQFIAYWGRIGAPMHRLNKKEKHFDRFSDAWDYARKKTDEKLWKGYKGFPNHLYFQMIQSPRGIAALIDKITKMDGLSYYETKKTPHIGRD